MSVGFIKTAQELQTPLLPHQERVVGKIQTQPGLVVAHGLGTGKTLSSIAAAVRLKPKSVEVLVPASLQENYKKELAKHVKGKTNIEVGSLQGAALKGTIKPTDLLIVDEAHRAKSPMSRSYGMIRRAPAKKRLLLTASPIYNKPEDIAPLVNLAAGKSVLPEGTQFTKKYVKPPPKGIWGLLPFVRKRPTVARKRELEGVFHKWVDYHAGQGGEFPAKVERRIDIPYTKEQAQLHAAAWGQLPWLTRRRIARGLPPDKKDLHAVNKFQAQARQISGSLRPFKAEGPVTPTPKVQRAFSELQHGLLTNPRHKAVIYSNFLGTINDYESLLKQNNVPYAKFTGGMSSRQRKAIVDAYNNNKIKALLVSSAGGEGLDLKATRQVQILEPHWNDEKIRQVVGRAVRHRSHFSLPPEERNVEIQRFVSYPESRFLHRRRPGVEGYLQGMSESKNALNEQFTHLMETERAT